MPYKNIKEQLENLKLRGMLQHFNDMDNLKISEQEWPKMFLSLLKSEKSYRQARSFMYKLGLAKLPQIKSMDNFDITDLPINHETLTNASNMKFIENHYNILIIGGSGAGKSHLAIGLAHLALHSNYRIRFYKFAELARELVAAQAHNYEAAFMAKLQRFNLLVIDEFGYSKASPLLFELFSNLYEKVSVIITTHLMFDEWTDIFGNVKY